MAYSTSTPPALIAGGLTYNGGPRVWIYTTTDATATIDTTGYITNGGNLGMRVGDIVLVFISSGTVTLSMYRVVTVSSTAPGAVDLSDGTVVGSNTNTD